MNKAVVLVGTSHAYQRGGESCSPSELIAFQDFIYSLCQKWQIELVTEEMSQGALEERGLTDSTVKQVVSSNSIRHKYIDPDREQRKGLGITENSDIKVQGVFQEWSDAEIERRIGVEYKKRESLWLWSLLLIDQWPSLFVCGSEHVDSFSKLLQNSQIVVHIGASDWAP